MGPTEGARVLQIHPLRRCNLRCLHCYSDSAPSARDQLSPELILGALRDARAEGYEIAGFSGGEPLLYPSLGQVLRGARELGFYVTVSTNAMLLNPGRVDELRQHVDLVAVSLDGIPEAHNRMRGSARAFEVMRSRLPLLRESGVPFGFIFTLTQHNLNELVWAARFAAKEGASLLQVHPLEAAGRASGRLESAVPDETEAAYAYVVIDALREHYAPRLRVHYDITTRAYLREHPDTAFVRDGPTGGQLAELLDPLVIEADGTVSPLRHGFARPFSLGNLHTRPLADLARSWRTVGRQAFLDHCQGVLERITSSQDFAFVNWYQAVAQE